MSQNVVYNCAFSGEGEEKYVDYFALTFSAVTSTVSDNDGEHTETAYYPSFYYLTPPQRKGYKFIGLSTDREGKNIVSRISIYRDNSLSAEREVTLTFAEASALPQNTVLFTVWEKIN